MSDGISAERSTLNFSYLVGALVLLQILDGLFTGIGVSLYGTKIEANLLLRTLMESFGSVEALILVKGFAIGVIFLLATFATKVTWVPKAMKALIALYLVFAVLPWGIIFTRETMIHFLQ